MQRTLTKLDKITYTYIYILLAARDRVRRVPWNVWFHLLKGSYWFAIGREETNHSLGNTLSFFF